MLGDVNKSRMMINNNDNGHTVTMTDNKIELQALALINDSYKYLMDLTTNGVLITDAIKFVQTNKEKITMSTMEDKESKLPEYNDDKDHLEQKQEDETGETDHRDTINRVF